MTIVLTSTEELRAEIRRALHEFEADRAKSRPPKVYTVNFVAKQLGKAHATIKKLVSTGVLKTTKDGLILASSLEEYLGR